MDQLSIRKEAAHIAAQVEGVTTRNFTAMARRIEHYIMGSAKLPEQFNEEDVIKQTVHEAMLEMTGANDVIRKFKEMDKEFHEKYKEYTLPQDNISKINENTAIGRKEDLYVFSNGLVMRKPHPEPPNDDKQQHDPAFASDLMKTFANYPATKEDFNQAVRRRHELYHDLGLEPEPFDKRHPHPPCDTSQGTVYLAPGGMPSTEGESIYLTPSDSH